MPHADEGPRQGFLELPEEATLGNQRVREAHGGAAAVVKSFAPPTIHPWQMQAAFCIGMSLVSNVKVPLGRLVLPEGVRDADYRAMLGNSNDVMVLARLMLRIVRALPRFDKSARDPLGEDSLDADWEEVPENSVCFAVPLRANLQTHEEWGLCWAWHIVNVPQRVAALVVRRLGFLSRAQCSMFSCQFLLPHCHASTSCTVRVKHAKLVPHITFMPRCGDGMLVATKCFCCDSNEGHVLTRQASPSSVAMACLRGAGPTEPGYVGGCATYCCPCASCSLRKWGLWGTIPCLGALGISDTGCHAS